MEQLEFSCYGVGGGERKGTCRVESRNDFLGNSTLQPPTLRNFFGVYVCVCRVKMEVKKTGQNVGYFGVLIRGGCSGLPFQLSPLRLL